MTRETENAHNHYHYPPEQPAVQVPASSVPILPPHPGQQGYWMVPPPPVPNALPGQPTEWAPVIAYGRISHSQEVTAPPPSPANPEWTALNGGEPIPIDEPVERQETEGSLNQGKKYTFLPPPDATAPDSAAGDKGQVPPGLGQGVDWFVVPIPALPGKGVNGPSDGPNAPPSESDDGEPSSKSLPRISGEGLLEFLCGSEKRGVTGWVEIYG
ncbi:hypothetical protein HOY82DRAFT_618216 [Tuber indicum]|nr:hypothetical protein HOY82DRAFT_618216 [Tuber indicum]